MAEVTHTTTRYALRRDGQFLSVGDRAAGIEDARLFLREGDAKSARTSRIKRAGARISRISDEERWEVVEVAVVLVENA